MDYLKSLFTPCQLDDVEAAALERRKDLKYILTPEQSNQIIELLYPFYDILTIDGLQLFTYQTQYFDDDAFTFYYDHLKGKPKRYKVRKRNYVDNDSSFLEIKEKFKGTTYKHRLATKGRLDVLEESEKNWMRALFAQVDSFTPTLHNEFQRITLLSKDRKSKVTLDQNIFLYWKKNNIALKSHVLEVKYDKLTDIEDFKNIIRSLNLHSERMSKYALGMNLLNNQLKTGIFTPTKNKILKING